MRLMNPAVSGNHTSEFNDFVERGVVTGYVKESRAQSECAIFHPSAYEIPHLIELRRATAAELDEMRNLVRAGMEDGAFGLSTGLFYVPGNYAPLDEVIELARVVARYGGIHQSHMRDEAAGVLNSVR